MAEETQKILTPPQDITLEEMELLEARLKLPVEFIRPHVTNGLRNRMVWILNSLTDEPVKHQKWIGVIGDVYQIAEDAFCPRPFTSLPEDQVKIQSTELSQQWLPGESMDEAVTAFYWKSMDGTMSRLKDVYKAEGEAALRAEIATIGSVPFVCPDAELGYWFHGFAVNAILLDAMRRLGATESMDTRFMTRSQAGLLGYCPRANANGVSIPFFYVSAKGTGNIALQGEEWAGDEVWQYEPRVMEVWHASQIAGLPAQKIDYSNSAALEGMLRAAMNCEVFPMDYNVKYAGEEPEGALARWMIDGALKGEREYRKLDEKQQQEDFNLAVQSAAIDILAARLAVQIRGYIMQTPGQVENRVKGTWHNYGVDPSSILGSAVHMIRANTLARLGEAWLSYAAPQMSEMWDVWRGKQFEQCLPMPFAESSSNLEAIKERILVGLYVGATSKEISEQRRRLRTGLQCVDDLFWDLEKNISGGREGFVKKWSSQTSELKGDQAASGVFMANAIMANNDVEDFSQNRQESLKSLAQRAINEYVPRLKEEEQETARRLLNNWVKKNLIPGASGTNTSCKYYDLLDAEISSTIEESGFPFGYVPKTGKWDVAGAIDAFEEKYFLYKKECDTMKWIAAIYERVKDEPVFV